MNQWRILDIKRSGKGACPQFFAGEAVWRAVSDIAEQSHAFDECIGQYRACGFGVFACPGEDIVVHPDSGNRRVAGLDTFYEVFGLVEVGVSIAVI